MFILFYFLYLTYVSQRSSAEKEPTLSASRRTAVLGRTRVLRRPVRPPITLTAPTQENGLDLGTN